MAFQSAADTQAQLWSTVLYDYLLAKADNYDATVARMQALNAQLANLEFGVHGQKEAGGPDRVAVLNRCRAHLNTILGGIADAGFGADALGDDFPTEDFLKELAIIHLKKQIRENDDIRAAGVPAYDATQSKADFVDGDIIAGDADRTTAIRDYLLGAHQLEAIRRDLGHNEYDTFASQCHFGALVDAFTTGKYGLNTPEYQLEFFNAITEQDRCQQLLNAGVQADTILAFIQAHFSNLVDAGLTQEPLREALGHLGQDAAAQRAWLIERVQHAVNDEALRFLAEAYNGTDGYDNEVHRQAFLETIFTNAHVLIVTHRLTANNVAVVIAGFFGNDAGQARDAIIARIQHASGHDELTQLIALYQATAGYNAADHRAAFTDALRDHWQALVGNDRLTGQQLQVHLAALGLDANAQRDWLIARAHQLQNNDQVSALRDAYLAAGGVNELAFQEALLDQVHAIREANQLTPADLAARLQGAGVTAGSMRDYIASERADVAHMNHLLAVHGAEPLNGEVRALLSAIRQQGLTAATTNDHLAVLRQKYQAVPGNNVDPAPADYTNALFNQVGRLRGAGVAAADIAQRLQEAGVVGAEAFRGMVQAAVNQVGRPITGVELRALKEVHAQYVLPALFGDNDIEFDNALRATIENLSQDAAALKVKTTADLQAMCEVLEDGSRTTFLDAVNAQRDHIFRLAINQASFDAIVAVMRNDAPAAHAACRDSLKTYLEVNENVDRLLQAGVTPASIFQAVSGRAGYNHADNQAFRDRLIQNLIDKFTTILQHMQRNTDAGANAWCYDHDGLQLANRTDIEAHLQRIKAKIDRLNADRGTPAPRDDGDQAHGVLQDTDNTHATYLLQNALNRNPGLSQQLRAFCGGEQADVEALVGCHLQDRTEMSNVVDDFTHELNRICTTAAPGEAITGIQNLAQNVRMACQGQERHRIPIFQTAFAEKEVCSQVRAALKDRVVKLVARGVSPHEIVNAHNELHPVRSELTPGEQLTTQGITDSLNQELTAIYNAAKRLAKQDPAPADLDAQRAALKVRLTTLITACAHADILVLQKQAFFRELQRVLPGLAEYQVVAADNYEAVRNAIRAHGAPERAPADALQGELQAQLAAFIATLETADRQNVNKTKAQYFHLKRALRTLDAALVPAAEFMGDVAQADQHGWLPQFVMAGVSVDDLVTHTLFGNGAVTAEQIYAKLNHYVNAQLEAIIGVALGLDGNITPENRANAANIYTRILKLYQQIGLAGHADAKAICRHIKEQVDGQAVALLRRGVSIAQLKVICHTLNGQNSLESFEQALYKRVRDTSISLQFSDANKDALLRSIGTQTLSRRHGARRSSPSYQKSPDVRFESAVKRLDRRLNAKINMLALGLKEGVMRAVFQHALSNYPSIVNVDGSIGEITNPATKTQFIESVLSDVDSHCKIIKASQTEHAKKLGLETAASKNAGELHDSQLNLRHSVRQHQVAVATSSKHNRRQQSYREMDRLLGTGTAHVTRQNKDAAKKWQSELGALSGDRAELIAILRRQNLDAIVGLQAEIARISADENAFDTRYGDVCVGYKAAFLSEITSAIVEHAPEGSPELVQEYRNFKRVLESFYPDDQSLLLARLTGFEALKQADNDNPFKGRGLGYQFDLSKMLETFSDVGHKAGSGVMHRQMVGKLTDEKAKSKQDPSQLDKSAHSLLDFRLRLLLLGNEAERNLAKERAQTDADFDREAGRVIAMKERARIVNDTRDNAVQVKTHYGSRHATTAAQVTVALNNELNVEHAARLFQADDLAHGPVIASTANPAVFLAADDVTNKQVMMKLDDHHFTAHVVKCTNDTKHVSVGFGAVKVYTPGELVEDVEYATVSRADLNKAAAKDGAQLAATYHQILEGQASYLPNSERTVYLQEARFDFPEGPCPSVPGEDLAQYNEAYNKALHNLLRVEAAYQGLRTQGYTNFVGLGWDAFFEARQRHATEIVQFNKPCYETVKTAKDEGILASDCRTEVLREEQEALQSIRVAPLAPRV